jgi:hypothetical protein
MPFTGAIADGYAGRYGNSHTHLLALRQPQSNGGLHL